MRTLRLHVGDPHLHSGLVHVPVRSVVSDHCQHAKKVSTAIPDHFGTGCGCKNGMSEKVKSTTRAVTISERNLQSAAIRLLPRHNKLVSVEVEYLRRILGDRATQGEIDETVMKVRALPWREIVGE